MSRMILEEQVTPATPAADKIALYPKAGGKVYKIDDLGVERQLTEDEDLTILKEAMSGDIVLECVPSTAGTSAATLNVAAVGTHTQEVVINLKNAAGDLHTWASLALAAATSEVVVDADVAAPAIDDATPDLVNGTVTVTLTYDTDEGATKTYAANDTVTLTVSQPTGGILGYSIGDTTFVDTIIA